MPGVEGNLSSFVLDNPTDYGRPVLPTQAVDYNSTFQNRELMCTHNKKAVLFAHAPICKRKAHRHSSFFEGVVNMWSCTCTPHSSGFLCLRRSRSAPRGLIYNGRFSRPNILFFQLLTKIISRREKSLWDLKFMYLACAKLGLMTRTKGASVILY